MHRVLWSICRPSRPPSLVRISPKLLKSFLTVSESVTFFLAHSYVHSDLTSEERQLLLDIRRRKAELLQVGPWISLISCLNSFMDTSAWISWISHFSFAGNFTIEGRNYRHFYWNRCNGHRRGVRILNICGRVLTCFCTWDSETLIQGQAEKLGNGKEEVQYGVKERNPIPHQSQPGGWDPGGGCSVLVQGGGAQ